MRIERILVSLVMLLAIVLPALAANPVESSSSLKTHWTAAGKGTSHPSQARSDHKQAGSDTSDDDSSASTPSGQTLDEEQGQKLVGLIQLPVQPNHGLGFWSESVDHAYEAWFYSITHPPLTPPPNHRPLFPSLS